MPLYAYQAYSKQGKKVSGTLNAQTLQQAKDVLAQRGLYPTSLAQTSEATKQSFFSKIFSGRVSAKDLSFFTKQMGVLLSSGIPLANALDLMIEQTEGALKNVVLNIRDMVREGKSLADALAMYPKAFESIYVQLVRAGEASGKLEIIFKRLQDYLEKRAQLKSKITEAVRGPLIQLGIIFLIVGFLISYAVPQMAEFFAKAGKELPPSTKLLMDISHFFGSYYLLIILVLIGIYALYRAWYGTKSGRLTIDSIKLKLPIIGYFARMNAIIQFSRTLGMLLEAGVNLSDALTIVTNIIDNSVLKNALISAKENIVKQGKIAEYLKQTNLFPAVAIYLINTGEQSGALDTMLIAVAEYYERDLDEYSANLTTILNPVTMLLMAVVVGGILIAIMAPMMGGGFSI